MNIWICRLLLFIFVASLFVRLSKEYALLSQGKHAYLSSQFNDNTPAGKAVDGNLSQLWPNVAITKPETYVYWYVDLGATRNINSVTIYYRHEPGHENAYRSRFSGFSLYISDDTEFNSGFKCVVNTTYPPLIYNVDCTYAGRYVKLYNTRSDGTAILELAEVQVFGCNSSTVYGINCEKNCSGICQHNQCNSSNGNCFSCAEGYRQIGQNCVECGKCLGGQPCNRTTGKCANGCVDGLYAPFCIKACENNEYGPACSKICGNCRNSLPCEKSHGICTNGCDRGFQLPNCDKVCDHGTYGFDCNLTCSGNCKDNDPCNILTGFCDRGCTGGWVGNRCETKCSTGRFGEGCLNHCSRNCKNGALCHHVTGACKDGCKDGFYSDNCNLTCTGNCLGKAVCNSSSGACEDGCAAGWKAKRCDVECGIYEYGIGCSERCGKCRNGQTCHKITGSCIRGCGPGYLTQFCNESCTPGYFGEDCLKKCSGNCQNQFNCNVGNGYCDDGCGDGWRGARCDEAMILEEQSNTSQLIIGMSSGAGILVLLIVLGVIALLLLRRLRNNDSLTKNANTKDSTESEWKPTDKERNIAEKKTENTSRCTILTIDAGESEGKDNTDRTEYQELSEIRDSNTYNAISEYE